MRHEESRDLTINARVKINGSSHPIELIGAGFIQLIQIFCYVLLFRPKILLIDEPDIHLHPNVQEQVPRTLSRVAREMGMKVLMTTHSPFIVRGAPIDANVYWVDDGGVTQESRQGVELSLGWGAFGKKVILLSEDEKIGMLKTILSQWPEIDKFVAVAPGSGNRNLPTPKQAKQLAETFGNKFKVLIHRDRDSLTDDEVAKIQGEYESEGVHLWATDHSDLEAYYCLPEFIQSFLDCDNDTAQGYLDHVLASHTTPFREQFNSQRSAHIQELWLQGGGPTNDHVWNEFQSRILKGSKGKALIDKLWQHIGKNIEGVGNHGKYQKEKLIAHVPDPGLAISLKQKIEGLLGS